MGVLRRAKVRPETGIATIKLLLCQLLGEQSGTEQSGTDHVLAENIRINEINQDNCGQATALSTSLKISSRRMRNRGLSPVVVRLSIADKRGQTGTRTNGDRPRFYTVDKNQRLLVENPSLPVFIFDIQPTKNKWNLL